MSQLLNPTSLDIKEDGVNASMSAELPIADYQDRPAAELFERIVVAKKSLGDQVLVLGHNYQRDEVIVHADLRGGFFITVEVSRGAIGISACGILRCAFHGGDGGYFKPVEPDGYFAGLSRRVLHGRYGGD